MEQPSQHIFEECERLIMLLYEICVRKTTLERTRLAIHGTNECLNK